MRFELNPKSIFIKLLCLIGFLLLANIIGIVFKYYFDHDYIYGLSPLFDFDKEMNIPTLYSSFALIIVSILTSVIALTYKRMDSSYLPWLGLAIIFLFLSIDETASIHNRLTAPSRDLLSTSGLFYWAWIIPYGLGLVVFLIAYLKFLLSLPKNIMILFVVSGITFVSGAIGFEMLGARHVEVYGKGTLLYAFLYTCEEFLEMLGIVIFIYTLLTYIVSQFKFFELSVNEPRWHETNTHANETSTANAKKRHV